MSVLVEYDVTLRRHRHAETVAHKIQSGADLVIHPAAKNTKST